MLREALVVDVACIVSLLKGFLEKPDNRAFAYDVTA